VSQNSYVWSHFVVTLYDTNCQRVFYHLRLHKSSFVTQVQPLCGDTLYAVISHSLLLEISRACCLRCASVSRWTRSLCTCAEAASRSLRRLSCAVIADSSCRASSDSFASASVLPHSPHERLVQE